MSIDPIASPVRLWVDDDLVDRPAPEGWIHRTTVAGAIALLAGGDVVEMSLDNDLDDATSGYDEALSASADDSTVAGQGKMIIVWIEERWGIDGVDLMPERVVVHSGNSEARRQMLAGIEAHARRVGRGVRKGYTPGGKPVRILDPRD